MSNAVSKMSVASSAEVCIVFICQAGELELKALLLAASLRANLVQKTIELIAAVPDPSIWGDISQQTRKLLKELDVREQIVDSPFGKAYPIGNKIAAMGVPTNASTTVFLDSDILCSNQLDITDLLTKGMKAKPADLSTFCSNDDAWHQIYPMFELEAPAFKVLSTVSKRPMMPYFNAGVVSVSNGEKFAKTWLDIALQIDDNEKVTNKRPWLDQIALPVTALKLDYCIDTISENFNYPAHLKTIKDNDVPTLCHYHSPTVIFEECRLTELVGKLSNNYPTIKSMIAGHNEWAPILTRFEHQKRLKPESTWFKRLISKTKKRYHVVPKSHDFILTGLPRSGTSLLCNLLHQSPNTIVVNEPREVFAALSDNLSCTELSLFYRVLRAKISSAIAIENKLDENGLVVEDTTTRDAYSQYIPKITKNSFALGTKNPLAYITRLRILCDALPHVPKVVMIRHPLDVLNSWERSFPHLRDIDLSVIPFASQSDTLLDGFQREQLSIIADERNLSVRRALFFNYLSALIERDEDKVTVIRYEDLVTRPQQTIAEITQLISAEPVPDAAFNSVKRNASKEKQWNTENGLVVEMLCQDFMKKWHYV